LVCILFVLLEALIFSKVCNSVGSQIDEAIQVNNVWVDVPLMQVLRDISVETGVIIATGPGMPDPLISLDAGAGKELEQCLAELVTGQGLYIHKKNKRFYLVSSGDPGSPSFMEIAQPQRLYLKYITAKHLKSSMPRSLQQYISSGERDSEVLVYAVPEIENRILDVINKLDIPQQQVVLEVLVVDLRQEASEQFGLDWEYTDPHNLFSIEKGLGAFSGIASYTSVPKGQLTKLLFTLQMLVGENKATIRSRPRVATLNGQKAVIDITLDEYFSIATDVYSNRLRTELEIIKSGVLLEITPHIGDNGDITVDVLTEVSDVVSRQNQVEGNASGDLPIIRRRKADTHVRVKDGDAIVIGGLIETQERINEKKVPGLSALPLVGGLFKTKDNKTIKKEVMIFITPRLMRERQFAHLEGDELSIQKEIEGLQDVLDVLNGSAPTDRSRFESQTGENEPFSSRHQFINTDEEIKDLRSAGKREENLSIERQLTDVAEDIGNLREVAALLKNQDGSLRDLPKKTD